MLDGEELEKTLGADPDPITEEALEVKGAQTDMARHILEGGLLGPIGLEIGQRLFDPPVVTVLLVDVHDANVGHVPERIHPILAMSYALVFAATR